MRAARVDVSFVAAFHERSPRPHSATDDAVYARLDARRVDARGARETARAPRRASSDARGRRRAGRDDGDRDGDDERERPTRPIDGARRARGAAPRRARARQARARSRGDAARRRARARLSDDAMRDEASGYAKRAAESAAAGVEERRPPRGGDAPAPGSWSWTLNWDHVMFDKTGKR